MDTIINNERFSEGGTHTVSDTAASAAVGDSETDPFMTFLFVLSSIVIPLFLICVVAYCFGRRLEKCLESLIQNITTRFMTPSASRSRVIYRDPCRTTRLARGSGRRDGKKSRLVQYIRSWVGSASAKGKEFLVRKNRRSKRLDYDDDDDYDGDDDVQSWDLSSTDITEANCQVYAKYGAGWNRRDTGKSFKCIRDRVFSSSKRSNDNKSTLKLRRSAATKRGKTSLRKSKRTVARNKILCGKRRVKFGIRNSLCFGNPRRRHTTKGKNTPRRSDGTKKKNILKRVDKDYCVSVSKDSAILSLNKPTTGVDVRCNKRRRIEKKRPRNSIIKSSSSPIHVGVVTHGKTGHLINGEKQNITIVKSDQPYSSPAPMFVMPNSAGGLPTNHYKVNTGNKYGRSFSLPDLYLPSKKEEKKRFKHAMFEDANDCNQVFQSLASSNQDHAHESDTLYQNKQKYIENWISEQENNKKNKKIKHSAVLSTHRTAKNAISNKYKKKHANGSVRLIPSSSVLYDGGNIYKNTELTKTPSITPTIRCVKETDKGLSFRCRPVQSHPFNKSYYHDGLGLHGASLSPSEQIKSHGYSHVTIDSQRQPSEESVTGYFNYSDTDIPKMQYSEGINAHHNHNHENRMAGCQSVSIDDRVVRSKRRSGKNSLLDQQKVRPRQNGLLDHQKTEGQNCLLDHQNSQSAQNGLLDHYKIESGHNDLLDHQKARREPSSLLDHYKKEPGHNDLLDHQKARPEPSSFSDHQIIRPGQKDLSDHQNTKRGQNGLLNHRKARSEPNGLLDYQKTQAGQDGLLDHPQKAHPRSGSTVDAGPFPKGVLLSNTTSSQDNMNNKGGEQAAAIFEVTRDISPVYQDTTRPLSKTPRRDDRIIYPLVLNKLITSSLLPFLNKLSPLRRGLKLKGKENVLDLENGLGSAKVKSNFETNSNNGREQFQRGKRDDSIVFLGLDNSEYNSKQVRRKNEQVNEVKSNIMEKIVDKSDRNREITMKVSSQNVNRESETRHNFEVKILREESHYFSWTENHSDNIVRSTPSFYQKDSNSHVKLHSSTDGSRTFNGYEEKISWSSDKNGFKMEDGIVGGQNKFELSKPAKKERMSLDYNKYIGSSVASSGSYGFSSREKDVESNPEDEGGNEVNVREHRQDEDPLSNYSVVSMDYERLHAIGSSIGLGEFSSSTNLTSDSAISRDPMLLGRTILDAAEWSSPSDENIEYQDNEFEYPSGSKSTDTYTLYNNTRFETDRTKSFVTLGQQIEASSSGDIDGKAELLYEKCEYQYQNGGQSSEVDICCNHILEKDSILDEEQIVRNIDEKCEYQSGQESSEAEMHNTYHFEAGRQRSPMQLEQTVSWATSCNIDDEFEHQRCDEEDDMFNTNRESDRPRYPTPRDQTIEVAASIHTGENHEYHDNIISEYNNQGKLGEIDVMFKTDLENDFAEDPRLLRGQSVGVAPSRNCIDGKFQCQDKNIENHKSDENMKTNNMYNAVQKLGRMTNPTLPGKSTREAISRNIDRGCDYQNTAKYQNMTFEYKKGAVCFKRGMHFTHFETVITKDPIIIGQTTKEAVSRNIGEKCEYNTTCEDQNTTIEHQKGVECIEPEIFHTHYKADKTQDPMLLDQTPLLVTSSNTGDRHQCQTHGEDIETGGHTKHYQADVTQDATQTIRVPASRDNLDKTFDHHQDNQLEYPSSSTFKKTMYGTHYESKQTKISMLPKKSIKETRKSMNTDTKLKYQNEAKFTKTEVYDTNLESDRTRNLILSEHPKSEVASRNTEGNLDYSVLRNCIADTDTYDSNSQISEYFSCNDDNYLNSLDEDSTYNNVNAISDSSSCDDLSYYSTTTFGNTATYSLQMDPYDTNSCSSSAYDNAPSPQNVERSRRVLGIDNRTPFNYKSGEVSQYRDTRNTNRCNDTSRMFRNPYKTPSILTVQENLFDDRHSSRYANAYSLQTNPYCDTSCSLSSTYESTSESLIDSSGTISLDDERIHKAPRYSYPIVENMNQYKKPSHV